jgi:hypothetical protein
MKETVRSLQAYFVLSGVVSASYVANDLFNDRYPDPLKAFLAVWLVMAGVMVGVGLMLPRALARTPAALVRIVAWTCVISVAAAGGQLACVGAYLGPGNIRPDFYASFVISVAVYGYVYASTKRLAKEAQASPPAG